MEYIDIDFGDGKPRRCLRKSAGEYEVPANSRSTVKETYSVSVNNCFCCCDQYEFRLNRSNEMGFKIKCKHLKSCEKEEEKLRKGTK